VRGRRTRTKGSERADGGERPRAVKGWRTDGGERARGTGRRAVREKNGDESKRAEGSERAEHCEGAGGVRERSRTVQEGGRIAVKGQRVWDCRGL
jgi:hypothetical protein